MNPERKRIPWTAPSNARPDPILKQSIGVAALALLVVLHTTARAQRYSEPVFTEVQASTDLAYGELEAHRLDVYQPEGDAEGDRLAIVLIHGGGFAGGDKQQDLFTMVRTVF